VVPKPLTAHQLDTLRLYDQLGSIPAVADFRGVTVDTVSHTLRVCRAKLGVRTNGGAVIAAFALGRGAAQAAQEQADG
jgi:DNA-binding CsgD family transcriptional regulator